MSWRGWIAAGGVAIVLALLVAVRPAPILGVDASALGHSVGAGLVSSGTCRKLHDDLWRCRRTYGLYIEFSDSYRVKVDGLGCWSATSIGPAGDSSLDHLSGCITILDYFSRD